MLDETGMEELQAALKQKAVSIAERAIREWFKIDDIKSCEDTVAEYGGKTRFTLPELLGLPAVATEKEVNEHCIIFAKAVRSMELMSHHKKHVLFAEGLGWTSPMRAPFISGQIPKAAAPFRP